MVKKVCTTFWKAVAFVGSRRAMKEELPPKEVFDALYPAVGAAVIKWALAEQTLEHWVAIIFHSPGGNIWKNPPFMLKAKREYLESVFDTLPVLASFRSEGLDLLERAKRLASIRDILVHGAVSGHQPSTGLIKFVRLDIDKSDNKHTIAPELMTVTEILQIGDAISNLTVDLSLFSQRLLKALMP